MKAGGQFTISTITNYSELKSIASEWSGLWNRCRGATSFQRPEWLLPWTESFTPQQLWTVAVRRKDVLVGLAPMFLYKSGSEKVLVPLGASISDYLDWLIDPEYFRQVFPAILETFSEAEIAWDRLEITDVSSSSQIARELIEARAGSLSPDNECPVLKLPASWEELEERMPAKFRHNLRTAGRRLSRVGAASIEVASEENLEELLSAMLELHGARWREVGLPGMLAEERVKAFHRRAASELLKRDVLKLYGLRLNGKLIATLYALSEKEVVYCYLQAFDPAFKQLSPGVQVLAAVIRDAIHMGKREVDFLRGREAYKYLWGAVDRPTYRVKVERKQRLAPVGRAA